jgi:hypothetical protein
MTAPHRPLRVELCEDRALPSTLFSIGHAEWPVGAFASHSNLAESHGRWSRDFARDSLESLAQAFRGQDFQNLSARAFEHSFAWNSGLTVFVVVYFRSAETGSQPVAQETPAEVVPSRGRFESAVEGGSDRAPTDRGKAANVSPPAIAIPPIANSVASNQPLGSNATPPAAHAPQVDSQPRINLSGNLASGGLGGPLVFLGVDPAEAPPADEPAPPLPLTISPPAPTLEDVPVTAITAASFASNALSGALPFNLSALEAGARELLSRVGNLDVELPDNVGESGEYWWLATAALVTGGVASTIGGNRARWADRRTVGFDSVLAKWGERNGGRFN